VLKGRKGGAKKARKARRTAPSRQAAE